MKLQREIIVVVCIISKAPRTTVILRMGAPSTLEAPETSSASTWYTEDEIAAAAGRKKILDRLLHGMGEISAHPVICLA